ncbi:MAG: class I SAM-dependent methyltransferase [Deltaproteobacteria bacterium]|nr:class I SAM-dependent methyltransferase [Deltaproteobacteria bacterium]
MSPGTDYSEAMVAQTRIRVAHLPNVRCQVRDLFTIGEADGRFDVVVAANVLHLLPDSAGGVIGAQAERLARRSYLLP